MITARDILLTVLLPGFVSLLLLFTTALRKKEWLHGAAVLSSFALAGYWWRHPAWSDGPLERLLFAGALLALAFVAGRRAAGHRVLVPLVTFVLVVYVCWPVLRLEQAWAGAIAIVLSVLAAFAFRLLPSEDRPFLGVLLCLEMLAAEAVLLMLSGSIALSQLVGCLAASVGGVLVYTAVRRPAAIHPSVAAAAAPLAGSFLAAGLLYADLPLVSAILFAAAPFFLMLSRRRAPQLILSPLILLLPLALAVTFAAFRYVAE